jgi:hypothetical protein
MSKASLELGGGNWAAKDTKLLGYAVGDTSGKYLPREFNFSRGADIAATRVNKDGLIEKYRENALLNSGDFSIAGASGGWVKNNATATSGYVGYDGTTNAWKLESTAETSFNNLNQQATNNAAITPLGSKVATFSVYLKAGTTNWARLNLNLTGNVYFDLENGVVGTATANILGQIESAGNGFYRCSITRLGGGVFDGCYIYLAESDGSLLPNTHPTPEHIFVQHPQLEYGLVATDYIETDSSTASAGVLDDLPRIDYTSGSAQLLMEPSRTNSIPYSEYAGSYTTSGTGTVTDNHSTSPQGILNAFQLNDTSASAYFRIEDDVTVSAANVGDHTLSVFIKKTTGSLSHYAGVQLDSTRQYVIVDTTNGTANQYLGTANDSFSVEDFSDDYWRVSITNDLASAADYRVALWPAISENGTSISTAATGSNVFYGIQLEKGSYATSYIPTYGASDTRAYDNVQELTSTSSTGITNNYNTTVFFDGSVFRNTANARIATLYDSSVASNPRVLLYLTENSGNHRVVVQYRVSGPADVTIATGYDYDFGDRIKMAMRLDGTSLDLFVNGVKQSTATIVQGDPIEVLRLMDVNADLGHFFNDFQVFSSSLSDAECIGLTTL